MKIDDTHIAIIKQLKDGRKSFREIADELGLSETTVRSKVTRMREEGIMEVAGLVTPQALPGHNVVVIGVKLNTMELVSKAEELSRLRGVVWVGVVTGRFDLMMLVVLHQDFGLLEFYTQEMSAHNQGVQSTETFVIYKAFNLKLPYIL